jgi:hypothetical protein
LLEQIALAHLLCVVARAGIPEYAWHLNRENAFDPGLVQLYAPGRDVWARMRLAF